MSTDQITCPTCHGKKAVPYTGRNPSTGNTFRATKLCDTCKGKGHIPTSEYPEHLVTPGNTEAQRGKEVDPYTTPADTIAQYRSDFAQLLPSHVNPDQWIRLAQGVFRRSPELTQAAMATPGSLFAALSNAARLGLEPGTEEFYLTPRKNKGIPEVLGIVGYQGIIELIFRAGAASAVIAEVVYKNDIFQYQPGINERPIHTIDWDADERGPLRLAYAYAIMKDGATSKVVVINKAQIERVKKSSQGADSKYSPWVNDEAAMWLKTACRQLGKWVPTSAEYRREQQLQDRLRSVKEVTDTHLIGPHVDTIDQATGEILDAELEPENGWPEVAQPGDVA